MEEAMAKQPDKGWREHVLSTLPKMEATMAEPITALTPAPVTTVTAPTPFSADFPSPPSFDPVELLPPAAAARLRLLRQRADDAHSLVPSFEDIHESSMAKIAAAAALRRLTDRAQDFGFDLKPEDRRVIAATKHLEKMTADLQRLQELQTVRTAAWVSASAALSTTEELLRNGRPGNTTLEAVEIEPPKLAKGEGILDAIERLRRRCRELKADLHRIASAPFLSSHCKAQMRAQIEQLAMQGQPDVSLMVEHDGKLVVWPVTRVQAEVIGTERHALAFHEAIDVVGLFAWLHRDALIAALDAEINTEADDGAALSIEARQTRSAEVAGDLLAAERDEAFFVWQAQAQGLPIEHRADINPVALLGLVLVTASRTNGASSPERASFDLIGGRR
jgi:hypothetical protein